MAMNDNETSVLTGILQSQTKDELMEIGEFFGVLLRQSDRKAAMIHRLEMAFRTETLRCLKRGILAADRGVAVRVQAGICGV